MFHASHRLLPERQFRLSVAALLLFSLDACSAGKLGGSGDENGDIEIEPGNSADNSDQSDESTHPLDDDDDGGDDSEESIEPSNKFDLATFPDLNTLPSRCPIDFLFVVDNSASMEDEQKNLIASFPSFIRGIQDTIETDDFHILVVDSDGSNQGSTFCTDGDCQCLGLEPNSDDCCVEACIDPANKTCENKDCSEYPLGLDCEADIGVGRIESGAGTSCNFAGDQRFIRGDAANLEDAFSCAANVGIMGKGDERLILAMNTAIAEPVVAKGGCNEGFLRSPSILVTVIITDEEVKQLDIGPTGTPQEWYDQLIQSKGGKPEHVVMIGFIGDTGLPGAICEPFDETMKNGAEKSPRLHEFIGLFGDTGLASSVCAPDYGPAFTEAIEKIDAACDALIPK
jgi:hypothetical protein